MGLRAPLAFERMLASEILERSGPGPNILWHNFIRVRIITTDHHTLGVFERPALLPASAVRAPQATKCRTEVLLMLSDSTNPFVRPRYTIPAAP